MSDADVLIVGAGPAGAVAASYLVESGFRVVCLEQGEWPDDRTYPGEMPEWELLERKPWNPDPNVRQSAVDYPCDATGSDGTPNLYAAVGGATVLYRGHWVRFLPSDFRVRTLDGVADDWPFTYEDLAPYYDAIDDVVGTSGLAGDPAYPPGFSPPLPPHSITALGRRVAEGMNRLGWHWWPAPNAIPSRNHRNLKTCARYGTCVSGCPNGSKASFDLVLWPEAIKGGAQLITGARARSITLGSTGLATGAVYVDRDGVEHHQGADVVILAANAIGTPRLLLLSANAQFPDGLANSSGLVGKRLMTHPLVSVVGMFDGEVTEGLAPHGQLIQSLQFYETDRSRGFVRGAKWALMPTGGPLGIALSALTGQSGLPSNPNPHDEVAEMLGHSVQWGIIAEDLPDESNCVTLHASLTDSDGIPAVRVSIRDDDNVLRNLEFQAARARESFEAAGAHKIFESPLKRARSHNIGTTKMGEDPATSVVDQYGRSHDVPNLYIYGSSVFPTSAGVNPTATICAVTLRSVEHLVEQRLHQPTP